MVDDIWWIFSEGNPPIKHVGNLFPKHAQGLNRAWAYITQRDNWFWFDEYARQWNGKWAQVQQKENVPKEYLAQLFLLGV